LCRGWMLSHVQLMLTPSMWGVVCALVIALPTYWGDATYKKHIGKYNVSEFLAALPSELDAAPKVIYRIRDAIGSVGKVGSSPDTFFLDPFSAATASSFLFAALQLAALPWLTQQNSDDTSVVSALMLAMICAGTTLFHQEGSVGGYPVRVDIFAMEITFVWLAIMCPTGLVHAASKYRGGDGALTHKFLPAANAPGRCLACSRLSGIVAIALVVMFEFELDQRTLDWNIHFDSSTILCVTGFVAVVSNGLSFALVARSNMINKQHAALLTAFNLLSRLVPLGCGYALNLMSPGPSMRPV